MKIKVILQSVISSLLPVCWLAYVGHVNGRLMGDTAGSAIFFLIAIFLLLFVLFAHIYGPKETKNKTTNLNDKKSGE